jgi:hypothetical protein
LEKGFSVVGESEFVQETNAKQISNKTINLDFFIIIFFNNNFFNSAIIKPNIAVYLQYTMPVNLNALIRYKTIDECLSNKNLKCTINVLIEKCSEKISESQGLYSGVSERTIRNDIRILRSDILGFNAPIVIEDGIYSYEDINYTIFGRPIKELDLLIEIQKLIEENVNYLENKNNNVQNLLYELSKITDISVPVKRSSSESGSNILCKRIEVIKQTIPYDKPLEWSVIFNILQFSNSF